MHTGDEPGPAHNDAAVDLRIGTPERRSAEAALEAHRIDNRLDATEFERRVAATQRTVTRSELLRIFADLPPPHPEFPSPPAAPAGDDDEDMPPVAVAGCLAMGLGIPVAVVLGVVYGAWWALAVPVAVTVVMTYIEQLRSWPRRSTDQDDPPPSR